MGRKKKEPIDVDIEIADDTIDESSVAGIKISSGCTLLNLALSNEVDFGYKTGKIVNIVGDKSSGKTLLAIEVMMYVYSILNKRYDIKLIYNEGEAAFDKEYAEKLGLPVNDIDFRESNTVEDLYEDICKEMDMKEKDKPDLIIYIQDSLDSISSENEIEQEFNKGSYGMSKPKQLSQLFRRLVRKIKKNNILLIIISQIRDKIGVTFGETKTRAGGHALDFYASQVIWLYEKGKIKEGNLPTGLEIKAKIKKNKVWKPFREVDFNILFEYGIDDISSNIDYLIENKYYEKNSTGRILFENKIFSREDFIQFMMQNNREDEIRRNVKSIWDSLEEKSKVYRKPKYEVKEITDTYTENTMFTGKT